MAVVLLCFECPWQSKKLVVFCSPHSLSLTPTFGNPELNCWPVATGEEVRREGQLCRTVVPASTLTEPGILDQSILLSSCFPISTKGSPNPPLHEHVYGPLSLAHISVSPNCISLVHSRPDPALRAAPCRTLAYPWRKAHKVPLTGEPPGVGKGTDS